LHGGGDLRLRHLVAEHADQIIERERVGILQPHLLTEPQCYYLHLDKEVR
jgi:hypothetical protein